MDIFPQGLTHGFAPKIAIFSTFFFQGIQASKMSFMIFQNKKAPFYAINTRRSKSRKIDIFQKGLTHGFAPKMAIFPTSFFLGNLDHENVFFDILEQKNAFLGYKNKKFKKSKNGHFSKGVNPWFCSKNSHFFNFSFLGIIGQENVLYDILEKKTPFYAIKTRRSKSRKMDIFPMELTHGFAPKMAIFPTFFSLASQVRKMSFMIFQDEKTPF